MLVMIEKCIRIGKCHTIHRYAKTNKNAWKTMIQVQNYHTSCTGM